MRGVLLGMGLLLGLGITGAAQQTCPYPSGCVVISQEAANAAASNAREIVAQRIANQDLKDVIVLKDRTIEETKATAAKNERDLIARMHATEIQLATATGQIIQCQASLNNNVLVITALVQNTKARSRIGLINF